MRTHGDSGTRLHRIWKGIKGRCLRPTASSFDGYGGRGIILSDEWHDYSAFRSWALEHGYRADRQIDRKNSDGPYSPSNCRWVPQSVNLARSKLDRSGSYIDQLTGRLDDETVSGLVAADRAYKLFDGQGLFLRVSPTGHMSWRLKFKRDGREKLLTLGCYPNLRLADARELAAAARCRIDRGTDPCEAKAKSQKRALRREKARGISASQSG